MINTTDSTGPVNTDPGNSNGVTVTGSSVKLPNKFQWTDGWYVAIACGTGILTADTRVGPLVFGILTVALIYQLNLLLKGK